VQVRHERGWNLRAALVGLALGLGCVSAQAVDLTKAYGTTVGCQNRAGQKVESDDMLLLTDTAIVTSTSTCTFVQKLTAPDATVVATALCTIEGEEGRSISQFSIVPAKGNPANLMIYDEYGSGFDEVAPCS
jgi:hypothetical protein